jgi:hypothetical protein
MIFLAGMIAGLIMATFIGGFIRARSRRSPPSNDESHDWHDNANVIRIDEDAPDGFDVCLAWECRVAGVTHREADVEAFVTGSNQHLDLVREPANPVSAIAIKVMGKWDDGAGKRCAAQLGYLPAEVAQIVAGSAHKANLAAALRDMFVPVPGKGAGIRLNVWTDGENPKAARRRRIAAGPRRMLR